MFNFNNFEEELRKENGKTFFLIDLLNESAQMITAQSVSRNIF